MLALRLTAAFVTIVAICAIGAVAGTTGTIEGRVVGRDDAPLAGAKIELHSEAGTQKTATDKDGHFHFLSLYPTKYWLWIGHSGYMFYTTRDFEVHADQVTSCNARMQPSFQGIYRLPRHGNNVVTCSY